MEKQTLNKHDFKKFLLKKLPDCRQEELIFWKNEIPLPVDLLYRIFDQRGELLKLYLDHISAGTLYKFTAKEKEYNIEFSGLPCDKFKKMENALTDDYNNYYKESNIKSLTSALAEKLYVTDYSFSDQNYISAISHQGRKYKRLYLPARLKECIKQFDESLLTLMGTSNGDMFGNIVADQLDVYRSGFSDAFAAIFNKLLDFILEKSEEGNVGMSTASGLKITQENVLHNSNIGISLQRIEDGSLWQPGYVDSKSILIINSKHPYFELINEKSAMDVLVDITTEYARIENETIRDSTAKILESFRQDLSRKLRIISERSK